MAIETELCVAPLAHKGPMVGEASFNFERAQVCAEEILAFLIIRLQGLELLQSHQVSWSLVGHGEQGRVSEPAHS
mgnify:CR=1 FL=1